MDPYDELEIENKILYRYLFILIGLTAMSIMGVILANSLLCHPWNAVVTCIIVLGISAVAIGMAVKLRFDGIWVYQIVWISLMDVVAVVLLVLRLIHG